MSISLNQLLVIKGIHLSEDESKLFQLQWEQIQLLKKDYDEVSDNPNDIILVFGAKGGK